MKKKLPFWNHNSAYYAWVRRKVTGCIRVLDVGCGDGTLAAYLAEDGRSVVGIDPDPDCIALARKVCPSSVRLEQTHLEDFASMGSFDAVIFCASLHHMDENAAIRHAMALLCPGGVLVIVGLAKPSRKADYVRDALRVVPSAVVTFFRRMRSAEEIGIPVSDDYTPMDTVRAIARKLLPGARLRHALHYRYLLEWRKPE